MSLSLLIPPILLSKLLKHKSYLVGGAVRDFILGNKCIKDFDFVIFEIADLEAFAREIADQAEASFVVLDAENKTYRVVSQEWQADFAAPRGHNITQDLQARDFTINAIAFCLTNEEFIDPLEGLNDLDSGLLRMISEKNLLEDPLRLLRPFRIAAQLKPFKTFQIEENTLQSIQKLAASLSVNQTKVPEKEITYTVAPERISAELWALLSATNCFNELKALFDCGVWETIFPEFKTQREVPPNDFHHLPLPEHTFELVRQYEQFVRPKLPSYCLDSCEATFSSVSASATTKMACLLHDIGKPATWLIREGKHTFYGHDALGAEMTETIGKRMQWPRQTIKSLSALVKNHLRPFNIAALDSEPTEKAERRFFRQLGENFYPLIALAWADLLSIRGPKVTEEMIEQSEKRLLDLLAKYKSFTEQEELEPLLLKGELLEKAIREAGLAPTKKIKELLTELRDNQLSGSIKSSGEAYTWFIKNAVQ